MSRTTTNILLAAIAVGIFLLALVIGAQQPFEDEPFGGADAGAVEQIEADHPEYRPWFSSLFVPAGGQIESGLFAVQAALGAGVLGFALGAMYERRKQPVDLASAPDAR